MPDDTQPKIRVWAWRHQSGVTLWDVMCPRCEHPANRDGLVACCNTHPDAIAAAHTHLETRHA